MYCTCMCEHVHVDICTCTCMLSAYSVRLCALLFVSMICMYAFAFRSVFDDFLQFPKLKQLNPFALKSAHFCALSKTA